MEHFRKSRLASILISLLTAVVAQGCATVQNSLSPTEIAALKIVGTDVHVTPATGIWWGNAEREFVEKVKSGKASVAGLPTKKVSHASVGDDSTEEYSRIIESPEAKQYLRDKLRGMIEQSLQKEIVPRFQGSRAARIEVHVISFRIPSAVQRVVLGGNPLLAVVTVLKDAETGKELAKMDRMAAGMAGSGVIGVLADQAFSDLEERVLANYVMQVRTWLAKE